MEFSISKMAEMHGVSRQTLIYYDKIGLFRPTRVDEKGTRYYDSSQMPFLREICFLKEQDIPLKAIQKNIESRNMDSVISLLESQIEQIERQQQELNRMKKALQGRAALYKKANQESHSDNSIFVEHYPERRAIIVPWSEDMTKDLLHLCYAKGWERLRMAGLTMESGFGAVVRRDAMDSRQPLKDAGSLFFLPVDAPEMKDEILIPEGDYLCMFRCCMPYKLEALYEFWDVVRHDRVETEGDIISVCLLDTTFHSEKMKEDFCQLQLRLRENE